MPRKVFIACPISKFFVHGTTLNADFRGFIQGVRHHCLKHTPDVFLALERERYGESLMTEVECTPLDYQGLQRADYVIAFPEDSMGVAVEIGWASAMGKRLLVFTDQRYRYSPLIRAIHTVCHAHVVEYEHDGYVRSMNFVCRTIDEFLSDSLPQLVAPQQEQPAGLAQVVESAE